MIVFFSEYNSLKIPSAQFFYNICFNLLSYDNFKKRRLFISAKEIRNKKTVAYFALEMKAFQKTPLGGVFLES